MKSTQGRVAKVETGSSEVSIELMIRALYAAGGDLGAAGIAIEPRLAATIPTPGPVPWPKPEEEKIPAKSAPPESARPRRSRKPIET
jgi:hypothetical protein